jgi:hypothetical protein
MAWAPPFDSKGRLHGGAMVLTLGAGGSAHDIKITNFNRREEPGVLKAKDSGDWDATDKKLYGTSLVNALDTAGSAEGFMRLSETPDWVIDLLVSGTSTAFLFKPDGATTLLSGFLIVTNFEDTYPAEDWCTFTFDYEVQGKPTRLAANITEPV